MTAEQYRQVLGAIHRCVNDGHGNLTPDGEVLMAWLEAQLDPIGERLPQDKTGAVDPVKAAIELDRARFFRGFRRMVMTPVDVQIEAMERQNERTGR